MAHFKKKLLKNLHLDQLVLKTLMGGLLKRTPLIETDFQT